MTKVYMKAINVDLEKVLLLKSDNKEYLEEANQVLNDYLYKKDIYLPASNLMLFDENSKEANKENLDCVHKKKICYELEYLLRFKDGQFKIDTGIQNLIKLLNIRRDDYLSIEETRSDYANGYTNGRYSNERSNSNERRSNERSNSNERRSNERSNSNERRSKRNENASNEKLDDLIYFNSDLNNNNHNKKLNNNHDESSNGFVNKMISKFDHKLDNESNNVLGASFGRERSASLIKTSSPKKNILATNEMYSISYSARYRQNSLLTNKLNVDDFTDSEQIASNAKEAANDFESRLDDAKEKESKDAKSSGSIQSIPKTGINVYAKSFDVRDL